MAAETHYLPLTFMLVIVLHSTGLVINSIVDDVPNIDRTAILKKSLNAFSMEMYGNVSQGQDCKGNIFLSPISIYQCLAMLEAGASGKTRKELQKTLLMTTADEFPHKKLGSLFKATFTSSTGVTLQFGNRLWIQKDSGLKSEYNKLVEEHYNLKVKKVNFQKKPRKSEEIINKWVSKATNDNIKDLLPQGTVRPDTKLVLTNAIYFRGIWAELFKKKETRKDVFTYIEGGKHISKKVSFMTRVGKVSYNRLEELDIQVIDLPYAGGKYSFSLFLPALESSSGVLTLDQMNQGLKDLKEIKMKLMLPRFEVTGKYELESILSRMGLSTLFSSEADLTRITDERVSVTKVIHEAVIKVNEKGTEASGATAMVLGRSFLPSFKANRPFTFMIRERESGIILFIGKVCKL